MKDFAYFFLPLGGILAALLIFLPTPRIHRGCISLCCLHLQLGPLQIGVAACICLYSFIRLCLTSLKLREVYGAAAAAAAAAAAGKPEALTTAAGIPYKGSSSYQLRHERNLWIELFCLVLWLFVWRCARLLGRHWQQIEALKAEVALLKHERQFKEDAAAAAAGAGGADSKHNRENKQQHSEEDDGDRKGGQIEMMRLRKQQQQQQQDSD